MGDPALQGREAAGVAAAIHGDGDRPLLLGLGAQELEFEAIVGHAQDGKAVAPLLVVDLNELAAPRSASM